MQTEDGIFPSAVDFDRGLLPLLLYQPRLSKTVQREIDPLQWTEIVGNVGGLWGEFQSMKTVMSHSLSLPFRDHDAK